MAFKLVCTVPFHGFKKGQETTDPVMVASLMASHDHHFVKVAMDPNIPSEPVPAPAVEQPSE